MRARAGAAWRSIELGLGEDRRVADVSVTCLAVGRSARIKVDDDRAVDEGQVRIGRVCRRVIAAQHVRDRGAYAAQLVGLLGHDAQPNLGGVDDAVVGATKGEVDTQRAVLRGHAVQLDAVRADRQ